MSSDRLLRLLLPAILLSACSIKENRAACPCALTLELTGLPVAPVVLGVAGEGYSYVEVVHADTAVVLPVPKGELSVSAVGGALAEGDGSVRIPEGEEAPPLYLFHADISTASAEQMILPVLLHKQYCALELRFTGPPGYGPPFEVEVEGTVGGWLPDGSPSAGPFSRRLLPGADGRATIR
ncbi:MAG: hypothetical protein IKP01_03310, partial [Bacteroidales bacterium]|nr:hypothetical protein [Bacteroidales bacterium]